MGYYKLVMNEKEVKNNRDSILGFKGEANQIKTLERISKNSIYYILASGVPEEIVPIVLNKSLTYEPSKIGRDLFKRKRKNSSCLICGSSEKLTIHHLRPVNENPELKYNYNNIKVICSNCHESIHNSKLRGGFTIV